MRFRGRSTFVGLFAGLCLAYFGLAFRELQASVHFADLFYVNSTLTPEDLPQTDAIQLTASVTDDVVTGGYCRSDILQAGLNVALADIDRQDAVSQFDGWSISLDRADRYIRHALSCNPASGDLWVRLAMTERAAGENPGELSKLMLRSTALTPSDISVMRARFVIWRKASPETLLLAEEAVEGDLYRLLSTSTVALIGELLTGSSDALAPYIAEARASLPRERRDGLVGTLNAIRGLSVKTGRYLP